MQILIAEDDAVARLIVAKAVTTLGHQCVVAASGTEAWALLQHTTVDVVITDWMMPGIDGVELCRRIRARAGNTYTYIILLTALADKAHLMTGIAAGADEYLTKPVDRDELAVRLLSAARVTALHDALATQNAALAAKNQDQDMFIHSVSHDLRAPLVSLHGLATILVEDYAATLDPTATRYIERIAANAARMQALLQDLLHLLQIGRGDDEQACAGLHEVVEYVLEQLAHTLHARGAQVHIAGRLPVVGVNRTHLIQVFTNLIDNAVHYTPAERVPVIQIAAREVDTAWEITVRDNGVGIPPALQPTIFRVFHRLPSGKTLHPGGTGVGLALVARIADTYGGTVWVESEEGVGSTFHLRLPHHAHDRGTTAGGDAVGGSERGYRRDETSVACDSAPMPDGGTHDVDHW